MKDNNKINTISTDFNCNNEYKSDFSKNKFNINKDDDLTDSDIEDPKYIPTFNSYEKNTKLNIIKKRTENNNFHNFTQIKDNNNEIQDLILKISKLSQIITNLENKNTILNNSLNKLQEDLKIKNNIINQFQKLVQKSEEQFNQYEENREKKKKEINKLNNKLGE